MNNVGVFAWIRDGVRRAVLLGFSDAVEQIGAPDEQDGLHPQLQALLRDAPRRLPAAESPLVEPIAARAPRKRLGRSIGQTQVAAGPAAHGQS